MALTLTYDNNFGEKLKSFRDIKKLFFESKKEAGLSTGFLVIKSLRKFTESGGRGSFKKLHPLTERYTNKGSMDFLSRRFRKKKKPLSGLGKFSRYIVNSRSSRIIFGFGKFRSKDVKDGSVRFDKQLEKIGKRVQKNTSFSTNFKMRRGLGATRRKKGNRPGIDFFPIRNSTTTIKTPARKITDPAFKIVRPQVFPKYSGVFFKNFRSRFESL